MMEGGDISNSQCPRLLFRFEGLVGTVPAARRPKEAAYRRLRRWERAVAQWTIEEFVRVQLWDIAWRLDYRFDIFCFYPQPFALFLAERLSREGIPFSNVFASTPDQIARHLAFMPDVRYVFDADVQRQFTYGTRGRIVSPKDRITL